MYTYKWNSETVMENRSQVQHLKETEQISVLKSLHQDGSYLRDCKQYLPPRGKKGGEGGLQFNHRAATDTLLSQIWHKINGHVTCLIFNKGGCSLPLRNEQVFKPQIWCIRGADKNIAWYSDQAALEPLGLRQSSALQHTEIFWGRKPWLVESIKQHRQGKEKGILPL